MAAWNKTYSEDWQILGAYVRKFCRHCNLASGICAPLLNPYVVLLRVSREEVMGGKSYILQYIKSNGWDWMWMILTVFVLQQPTQLNRPVFSARCQPSAAVESSWNMMAHGDAREGKWRRNWWVEWVASTLHTTSEHGVSSITSADAHTSTVGSRLNWRPCRFKWTRPFRWKTKSGFCACAITFRTPSTHVACSRNT
jgi:hypothetical protein